MYQLGHIFDKMGIHLQVRSSEAYKFLAESDPSSLHLCLYDAQNKPEQKNKLFANYL